MDTTHKCTKCHTIKPYTEFYRSVPNTGWLGPDGRRKSHCKDCSRAYSRTWNVSLRGPCKTDMLYSAKRRAERKGLNFAITKDDFDIPSHCPVLGIPLIPSPPGMPKAWDNSPTLDRIDNREGYVPANVLVISWKANRIKTDASLEEIAKVLEFFTKLKTTSETLVCCSEQAGMQRSKL